MKLCVLNKQNNPDLIVFFSGWGTDKSIFRSVEADNYDIIMFFDYREFSMPDFDFSGYKNIYLIAWSMGVLMSQILKLNYAKKIAINGTSLPVNDNFGIPEKIYDLTINNFNDTTKRKFAQKIGMNSELTRTNEELKEELIKIKEFQKSADYKPLNFDKAIISTEDKIFPYKNQKAFWQNQNVEIKELKANHYIKFNSWSEVLNV